MIHSKLRAYLASSAALGVLFGASPTFAQQAQPSANAIEEVVVTATRSTSTVNRVSMSVSAVTQKTMEVQGINNVSDLSRIVPGVTFRKTGSEGDPVITIRGVGGNGLTVGAPTTGVYLDDAPLQRRNLNGLVTGNGSPFPQLFDLDRVEVLRGPQGTLYGGSSEGGTIRFITPTPSLTHYSGEARTEVSQTDHGGISNEEALAVGGPVVEDKLGFRASFINRHNAGWIDALSQYDGHKFASDVNFTDSRAFRGSVLWTPTARLKIVPSIYVGHDYANADDTFWEPTAATNFAGSVIKNGVGSCQGTGSPTPTPGTCKAGPAPTAAYPYPQVNFAFPDTRMPAFTQNAMPWYGPYSTGNGRYLTTTDVQYVASPRNTNLTLPSLTLDYDFGPVDAKSITSYVDDDTFGMRFSGGNAAGRVLPRFVYGAEPCQAPYNQPQANGLCYLAPAYQPGNPDTYSYLNYTNQRNAIFEELRFSSQPGKGPLSWVGGLYFSDSTIKMDYNEQNNENNASVLFRGAPEAWWAGDYALPPSSDPQNNPNLAADIATRKIILKEREYAAFGEANYNLTDKLKLTVGLRFTQYDQEYDQTYGGVTAGNPLPGTSLTNPGGFIATRDVPSLASNSAVNPITNPADMRSFATNLAGCPTAVDCPYQYAQLKENDHPVTPKVGVTYQITQADLVYFTWSNGFRPGGVNPPVPPAQCVADLAALGVSQVPSSFTADSVSSYEVGSKLRLLDGHLQLNSSAFMIDWKNMQFNLTLRCGIGFVNNAGRAQSTGAELQATGLFGGWLLDANIGYDHAVFAQDVKNTAGAILQYKGDNVGVPDWTIALDAQYAFHAAGLPAFVRADYQYTGRYDRNSGYGTAAYDPLTHYGDPTQIWNARAGITVAKVDWSLFVQNLTDSSDFNNKGHGQDSLQITGTSFRPRTIGVQAAYRF